MMIFELPDVKKAIFLKRPNRFLGIVKLDGIEHKVHIHDPGRLKELLYPGNEVLITYKPALNRKTSWDLLAAKKQDEWIFVHSGYHRELSQTILQRGLISKLDPMERLIPEIKVDGGRLDFLANINGENVWIEVKGCTLIKGDIALFPDAPTKRGTKHVSTLIDLKKQGDRAAVILLIFSKKAKVFSPNKETDPKFYEEFYKAKDAGVEIYPISLFLDKNKIYFNREIPVVAKGF